MAALSHLEYLKQVERNPQVFCGRRVLAAIIMKRKQKKGRKDVMKVVSMGMGESDLLNVYKSQSFMTCLLQVLTIMAGLCTLPGTCTVTDHQKAYKDL